MWAKTVTFRAPTNLLVVVEWRWIGASILWSLVFPFFGVPATVALIVHELGHVIAARLNDVHVHRMELRSC